jgi:hypothetical protein
VIVVPQSEQQLQAMAAFMQHYANVAPAVGTHFIGWVSEDDGKLKFLVCFNAFMGKVCQIHVAAVENWHFTPKQMLKATFDYAFSVLGRERLIGIVNGNNEKALKYDEHLGFKEAYRMPGMHDDGGDIVLMTMDRADCKYFEQEKAA